ncbi:hypothetical protein AURDEDRAFT_175557 [Auricularia subglabra TFB-10046 SS5]|uniref:Uncharacterized protein n=1 Tax=Auricularia subglabra (strain TFB-10046 / SS5) TaxID=717982 RepID=J0WT03_AURST|nr:hypothetical protein AURDEDRAFT_175557 [Auricularia subglabra TFB-10046 SS5]
MNPATPIDILTRRPSLRQDLSRRSTPSRSQSLLSQPPGQTAHPDPLTYDKKTSKESTDSYWPEWAGNGWGFLIHPTGVLYFHNPEHNLTTSIDLFKLARAEASIQLTAPDKEPDGFKHYERLVELVEGAGKLVYVNHEEKAVSYLGQPPAEFELQLNEGPDLRLTARYWAFIQTYPCHYKDTAAHRYGKDSGE